MKNNIQKMIKIIIFIQAIVLTQSCEKITCKDDALTIERTNNNSVKLRIDGYYYGDISGINAEYPNIYLLYQNGIFSNANSYSLSDAETGNVTFNFPELKYQHKGDWGVYKIDDNDIEIEYWASRSCGGVGLLYERGTILNDTTFKILYWRHSVRGETEREENVEAIFKFHEYTLKPDSTIKFIQ